MCLVVSFSLSVFVKGSHDAISQSQVKWGPHRSVQTCSLCVPQSTSIKKQALGPRLKDLLVCSVDVE